MASAAGGIITWYELRTLKTLRMTGVAVRKTPAFLRLLDDAPNDEYVVTPLGDEQYAISGMVFPLNGRYVVAEWLEGKGFAQLFNPSVAQGGYGAPVTLVKVTISNLTGLALDDFDYFKFGVQNGASAVWADLLLNEELNIPFPTGSARNIGFNYSIKDRPYINGTQVVVNLLLDVKPS